MMRWLPLLLLLGGCGSIMPGVEYATPMELRSVACPSNPAVCGDVRAVYDHKTRTIYLPAKWSPDNEYDLSMLVHEFVHHVQGIGGDYKTRCVSEMERDAYAAQIAFLKARGDVDPYKTLGTDRFTLLTSFSCGWN